MTDKLPPLTETVGGSGRRRFLNSAAVVGLAGVGLAACNDNKSAAVPAAAAGSGAASDARAAAGGANATHLKPGELDSYYGLWSGGHTGDLRVLGLPSGRELLRIPCFVPDALVGWGLTNESKQIMGTKADGSLKYTVGDTHHTHASYKDGNYDGRGTIGLPMNGAISNVALSPRRSPGCATSCSCRAHAASVAHPQQRLGSVSALGYDGRMGRWTSAPEPLPRIAYG